MSTDDRKTILAVDDDPDVLRLVEAVLQRSGFHVVIAGGATEALAVFKALDHPPDLVLTDVVMPGISGPVLVERLLEVDPNIRVLFMSGYDDRQIIHHYVVKPGFPLLAKPFTFTNLASKVREILAAPVKGLDDRAPV